MDISRKEQQECIAARIEELIELDLMDTRSNFARAVGIDASGLYKMLKGDMKITATTLKKIANTYGVNIDWLAYGIGDTFKSEQDRTTALQLSQTGRILERLEEDEQRKLKEKDEQPEPKVSLNPSVGRPYYDVDFLGGYGELFNDGPSAPLYNIDFPPYNKDGVTWCNITGHSMEPRINSGDIIALKEIVGWQDYIIYGEIYAIVTSNDMRTIKIIRKSKQPDHLRLVPINTTDFDEQDIPIRIITHLYKVLCSVSRY